MFMQGNKEKKSFVSSVYYLKCWNTLLLSVFDQKPKYNLRACLDCCQTGEYAVVLPF